MPLYKGPIGFGRLANMLMTAIMCAILGVYILWTNQNLPGNEAAPIFTVAGYCAAFFESFILGYTVGDLVPVSKWGGRVAHALHATGKVSSTLVNALVFDLIFTTCLSLGCSFINNVGTSGLAGVLAGCSATYIGCLVIAFIAIVLFQPLALKGAAAISGFNPEKPEGAKGSSGNVARSEA